MLPKVIYSPLIRQCAVRTCTGHAYLAESDPQAAQKALDAIEAGTDVLEQFPHAGRPADDLEPEHGELLIPFGASGYAVFYEVGEGHVLILPLKHQREAGY